MHEEIIELIDKPEILSLIFHPRPDVSPPDIDHDIIIPVSTDINLGGRIHLAESDSPLILFFHGNGEIASDYDEVAPSFVNMGISFLIVDYRGYGRSGGMPTIKNLLEDARSVFVYLPRLLSEQGLSPSAVYIMGRSLGSISAIEIASLACENISGLIIESGFAYSLRLIARLGGPIFNLREDGDLGISALAKIPKITTTTLIIHGEEDDVIPVDEAHILFEYSGSLDKRLVTIPNAGHNDLFWSGRDCYIQAIRKLILHENNDDEF